MAEALIFFRSFLLFTLSMINAEARTMNGDMTVGGAVLHIGELYPRGLALTPSMTVLVSVAGARDLLWRLV